MKKTEGDVDGRHSRKMYPLTQRLTLLSQMTITTFWSLGEPLLLDLTVVLISLSVLPWFRTVSQVTRLPLFPEEVDRATAFR